MADDINQPFARITPVDASRANRVLNGWSLLRNFVVTQVLGIAYGVGCCVLPMSAGQFVAQLGGFSFHGAIGLSILFTFAGAGLALAGLYLFGYPVLLFERMICSRFLRTIERNGDGALLDETVRVVELVPRDRWKKRFCLDTAIDLMTIHVDHQGVWMKGDRYLYELPADSILGADMEGFRPPACSFEIYMVTIYVRTEEGTIDLPVSYRDYRWLDLWGSRRREQAMELAHQISSIARGDRYAPPRPPTIADQRDRIAPIPSSNPYAAPAIISE